MRVEYVEKCLGDLGQFVVEFVADTSRQVGKSLDHPLNMRILDLVLVELQTSRDLRVFAGKLRTHTAQKYEFTLVIP